MFVIELYQITSKILKMSFILIYITHANESKAMKVANLLVEQKYCACSNIFPITSAYWWNNTVENDKEWVTIVKTVPENWEAVKSKVEEIHPYDVPCILKINVEANEKYEQWIKNSVELK